MSTTTTIPFTREPTDLPDKHGEPIKVGDWVRAMDGRLWKVVALQPTEAYDHNSRKKLGTLDPEQSHVRLMQFARHATSPFHREFAESLIFDGRTEWGARLTNVERLDLSEREQAEMEAEIAATTLANIERMQTMLTDKHRVAQRAYDAAVRKAAT